MERYYRFIFLLLQCFTEIPLINANSADLDQIPHFAASYFGQHYMPLTLVGVFRLKWVRSGLQTEMG